MKQRSTNSAHGHSLSRTRYHRYASQRLPRLKAEATVLTNETYRLLSPMSRRPSSTRSYCTSTVLVLCCAVVYSTVLAVSLVCCAVLVLVAYLYVPVRARSADLMCGALARVRKHQALQPCELMIRHCQR